MIKITKQFQHALDVLENTNDHIFITGKAGTGKSTLLAEFRNRTQKNCIVLAPTGVAAVNVKGQTIHSFFGFTPGLNEDEVKKSTKTNKNNSIIRNLDTLIIDEISMVRADVLDYVDMYLKIVRKSPEPFGGIQMVLFGDLYQLPPVVTNQEMAIFTQLYESPYFFDAQVMRAVMSTSSSLVTIQLDTIFRQSDETFVTILNAIRESNFSEEHLAELNKRVINKHQAKLDNAIHLVATNAQAELINNRNLEKAKKKVLFEGTISGDFDQKYAPTPHELILAEGARVMFLNNEPSERWINGTTGEITRFIQYKDDDGYESPVLVEVQIDNGNKVEVEPFTWTQYSAVLNEQTKKIETKPVGTYTQIPLKLAWAITIHKSQGKTFDNVVIDIGKGTFAHGQLYVALSRCRSLDGIILKTPIRPWHVKMDRAVQEFLDIKMTTCRI